MESRKMIGEAPRAASPLFDLEPVDEIDGAEEVVTRFSADATAGDRECVLTVLLAPTRMRLNC
jgi:hypothetical protein